jgi:hypothetical protein
MPPAWSTDGSTRFTTHILWLHHIQRFPTRAIAKELDLSLAAVRRIISQHRPERCGASRRDEGVGDEEVMR